MAWFITAEFPGVASHNRFVEIIPSALIPLTDIPINPLTL